MNATVEYKTATALQDAGFSQPQPKRGQFWWSGDRLLCCVVQHTASLRLKPVQVKSPQFGVFISATFAPTATDILAQFPHATLEKIVGGEWMCRWPITENGFSFDARYGACPHEVCAEAYLAWRKFKGL